MKDTISFSCPGDPDKFPEKHVVHAEVLMDTALELPIHDPARPGRFITVNGLPPLFQFPKDGGFIFNEGGRGLTLTLGLKFCPFRLYLAGWVLAYTYDWGKYACFAPRWKFWVHYHWTFRTPKTR